MLTGKQRELAQRDELFLQVARDLLLEGGYHGLTMAAIAKTTGFAKATLYQRFESKDALVVELWQRTRKKRFEVLHRALTFEGLARERLVAMGLAIELHAKLNPEGVRLSAIFNAEAVFFRLTPTQRKDTQNSRSDTFRLLAGVIDDAVDAGDLELPHDGAAHSLCRGLWALGDGCYATVLDGHPSLEETDVIDPWAATWEACDRLVDGYGWRPLSTDWDYGETRERALATVLAPEARELARQRNADGASDMRVASCGSVLAGGVPA